MAFTLLCHTALADAQGSSPSTLPASKSLTQLRLDTWGVRDGLPGYDLTSLAQTPDGFLWIGSTQGLIRFDGSSFSLFNSANVPGLTNSTIRSLDVSPRGNLLVGAEWCGYGEIVKGAFTQHFAEKGLWNSTHYFHQSPDGTLWVGYQGWNFVLRERAGTVDKIDIHGVYLAGAVDLPNGDLLAGMNYGGLFRITHAGKITPFVTDTPMAGNDITAIVPGDHNSVWIGTDSNGLYRLSGKHLTHYSMTNGLRSNTIRCLCVDKAGRLWAGTNSGIDCLGVHGWEHFGVADGLAADNVTSILQGGEGNVWVATGIFLNRFANTHLTPVSLGPGSLRDTFQINVAENGSLLCGTRGGLWKFPSKPNALPAQLTTTLTTGATEAANGDLISWWPLDLTRYVIERRHLGMSTQYVVDFIPIRVDDTGNGLAAYGQTAEFQRLPQDKSKTGLAPTYPNLVVYDIKRDPRGNLWFATTAGLMRLTAGSGRPARHPSTETGNHTPAPLESPLLVPVDVGLPAGAHALSLDVSDPAYFWIATDHGLARVDWSMRRAASIFTAQDGLPSSEFLQMVHDGQGLIWLGGYFGICSVTAADLDTHLHNPRMALAVRLYTAADGVRSYPYVAVPARTPDGTVWFVGHSGLTKIEPGKIPVNALRPPVAIEEATVDGTRLKPDVVNDLRPGAGALKVRYAGLSYVQPERVRFKYRLEGFDKTWIDAGAQRVAAYTNLSAGTYQFDVIACNNDGVWSVGGASVTFRLAPHYYETAWFKALAVCVGLIIVAFVIRLRTQSIALRNRELEIKVEERTVALSEANQHLVANQAEIEAQNDELQAIQAELEAQNDELMKTQDHLAEANARLLGLANTDGLTGLYNHRTFHSRLDEEWARHLRYGTSLSIILMDVDSFKQFNDTYGHPAGDDVLRRVAEVIKATVRAGDMVARYGGEEFVVIAPEADSVFATGLAERVRQAIEQAEWPLRPVTASFGVATAKVGTQASSDLVTEADTALYRSKHGGRNRVTHFFDIELGQPTAGSTDQEVLK